MKKCLLILSAAVLLAAAAAAQANSPEAVYDPQGRLIPHDVKRPQPAPDAAAVPPAKKKAGKRQPPRAKAAAGKTRKPGKTRRR